jgi:hypothetical protein
MKILVVEEEESTVTVTDLVSAAATDSEKKTK